MFVACSHRGGLNCNGVIIAGPAPQLPPTVDIPRPPMFADHAITQTDDPNFIDWARSHADSQLVRNGVILWADSRAQLEHALYHGKRAGTFALPGDWADNVGHIA